MHVEIASKINRIIEAKDLTALGKLEQDLVFGDATSKEIITYISANQKIAAEDKVGHAKHDSRTCVRPAPACIERRYSHSLHVFQPMLGTDVFSACSERPHVSLQPVLFHKR